MTYTFNVYRREKGDINPPVAIATGLTSKNFTDDTIAVNKEYLYSIGATDGTSKKVGDEIEVSTILPSLYQIDYAVESGAWVNRGSVAITETWTGTPTFETDAMVLDGTQWLDIASNEVFNFGSDLFEVSFELMQINMWQWRMLMNAIYYSGTSYSQYGFDAGKIYVGESWGGLGTNLQASSAMTTNVYHTVTMRRTSPTLIELVVDDVVVASRTIAATVTLNFNRNSGGTRLFNITWENANSPFIGKVKRFTVKRL